MKMHFLWAALTTLSLLYQTASAELNKPEISPPTPGLDDELYDALPRTYGRRSHWPQGWIPKNCKDIIEREKKNPNDVEVFQITYTDCAQPWIFCRHKDSPMSTTQMIDFFGRIPLGSRRWVRHMVAVPGVISGYNLNDDILISGYASNLMTVFVHEIAHSLDSHVPGKTGSRFSTGKTWAEAYEKDPVVSDGYARTNQVENFAQMTVIALYDNVVQGGFKSVQPNADQLKHKLAAVKLALGQDIQIVAGFCTSRLANSETVWIGEGPEPTGRPKTSSHSKRSPKNSNGPPDVSLLPGIEEIPPTHHKNKHVHPEVW